MIQTEEQTDGTLLLVDGADRVPLDDDELVDLVRAFARQQEVLDKDRSPEKAAEVIAASLFRLLKRLTATVALRLQELDDDVGRVAEGQGEPPPPPEGILVTIDEARLVVNPVLSAAQLVGSLLAQMVAAPNAAEQADVIASYRQTQEALSLLGSRLVYGLRAYEAAAQEEADEEAAEEAADGEEEGA